MWRVTNMPKLKSPNNDLAAALRALHDNALIDEIQVLVGKCVSMLAVGEHDDAMVYAQGAVEVAKGLQTPAYQESVWVTFAKLDALLVASGVIEPLEDEIVCTMPWAEA